MVLPQSIDTPRMTCTTVETRNNFTEWEVESRFVEFCEENHGPVELCFQAFTKIRLSDDGTRQKTRQESHSKLERTGIIRIRKLSREWAHSKIASDLPRSGLLFGPGGAYSLGMDLITTSPQHVKPSYSQKFTTSTKKSPPKSHPRIAQPQSPPSHGYCDSNFTISLPHVV
ncbi:Uncharacterized protein HZ326_6474 [Fusarium oxysporum f. sp. albedinis]|nr:Uncharacterized protein HZ326_6474 [Fusarium oxysporum f. sp. albedinis]